MLLKCYSVLQATAPAPQSATPVLLCTTKYHSSAALSTAPALQSTTPTLLRVLQSITPVLPCTTTVCYKVLLRYCFVVRSATEVEWVGAPGRRHPGTPERRGAGTPALPGSRHPGAPLRRGSSCARSSNRLCQKSWAGTRAHGLPPAMRGVIPLHQLPSGPWVKHVLIPSGFFCSGAGWWHGE